MRSPRPPIPQNAKGIYFHISRKPLFQTDRTQLIVATNNNQIPFLDKLSTLSQHPSFRPDENEDLGPGLNDSIIPCYFLSPNEAIDLEPDLSHDLKGALLVTETGIIDSQALVDSLSQEIEDRDYLSSKGAESSSVGRMREETRGEGVLVLGTRVVRIDRDRDEKGKEGWVVQMETGWDGENGTKGQVESVRCEVVVNAAGLGAASLLEGVVPPEDEVKMYLVKGKSISLTIPTSPQLTLRQLHVLQRSWSRKRLSLNLPLSRRKPRPPRYPPHPRLRRQHPLRTRYRTNRFSGPIHF
jgi:L-2-hydroxyglutarate oxidase LhgO